MYLDRKKMQKPKKEDFGYVEPAGGIEDDFADGGWIYEGSAERYDREMTLYMLVQRIRRSLKPGEPVSMEALRGIIGSWRTDQHDPYSDSEIIDRLLEPSDAGRVLERCFVFR